MINEVKMVSAKASKSLLIISELLILSILGLYVFLLFSQRFDSGVLLMVILLSVLSLLFVYIFYAYKVTIDGEILYYRRPFGRAVSVRLDNITSAKIVSEKVWIRTRFGPVTRLVIKFIENNQKKQFYVNIRIFKRGDISAIMNILNSLKVTKR